MSLWNHLVETGAPRKDEPLRKAEREYKASGSPEARQRYIKSLRRAGNKEEADNLESEALLKERFAKIRWNKPDDAEIARLVKYYTPEEIKELLASNTPNRLNIIGNQDAVYHRTLTMADGSPRRYRVNGKLKTWKTRPWDFRLPVMYGGFNRLSDSAHLTPNNATLFMLDPSKP